MLAGFGSFCADLSCVWCICIVSSRIRKAEVQSSSRQACSGTSRYPDDSQPSPLSQRVSRRPLKNFTWSVQNRMQTRKLSVTAVVASRHIPKGAGRKLGSKFHEAPRFLGCYEPSRCGPELDGVTPHHAKINWPRQYLRIGRSLPRRGGLWRKDTCGLEAQLSGPTSSVCRVVAWPGQTAFGSTSRALLDFHGPSSYDWA